MVRGEGGGGTRESEKVDADGFVPSLTTIFATCAGLSDGVRTDHPVFDQSQGCSRAAGNSYREHNYCAQRRTKLVQKKPSSSPRMNSVEQTTLYAGLDRNKQNGIIDLTYIHKYIPDVLTIKTVKQT